MAGKRGGRWCGNILQFNVRRSDDDQRTRHAGHMTFIEFHLTVSGQMTVSESHAICDRIEDALEAAIDGARVTIHVEPDGH